jgi:hypothetical protein
MTYVLARRAGLDVETAQKIAWADQFTDDLTQPEPDEIQTQCDIVGNWAETDVQLSVLVPFHFIPGSNHDEPWMTTRNSARARKLLRAAEGDVFRLGVALHGFQDTYSHERFSGRREDLNSCYEWYDPASAVPNVGHAEMMATPDMIGQVWMDPRDQKTIYNRHRALSATRESYRMVVKLMGVEDSAPEWSTLEASVKAVCWEPVYDRRKAMLRTMSGDPGVDYSSLDDAQGGTWRAPFVEAAKAHRDDAMDECGSLQ